MNRSESINELATALVKVQSVIEGAKKDSDNPFFHSKYADLTSVWEACRKPLSDNGLSVVQGGVIVDGQAYLETMLQHSSGQFISGMMPLRPSKDDPQGFVAACTYMRRAGLAAIVGVAPEDDDGNEASGKPKPNTQAAANYVRDEKIKSFDEKHEDLKGQSKVVKPEPELKEGEQVIHGVLGSISNEMPTKTGKPYVSIEVGPHKMNVFDKAVFTAPKGEKSPLHALLGQSVSVIADKKGKYLNFIAISKADIQIKDTEPEDPFALGPELLDENGNPIPF